jgi:hypothetical protein
MPAADQAVAAPSSQATRQDMSAGDIASIVAVVLAVPAAVIAIVQIWRAMSAERSEFIHLLTSGMHQVILILGM